MRIPIKMLILMVLAWLWSVGMVAAEPLPPPDLPTAPASSPSTAPSVSPSPNPDADDLPNFYKPFLDGTRPLGFSPDQQLYDRVRNSIRDDAYVSPSDEDILKSVDNEAHALVQQAGQNVTALDAITVDDHFPQAVVDAYGATINRDLIWYALIRGELRSMDDPYSVLMIPDDYSHMEDSMDEHAFGGVGIYIELDKDNNNKLTITEPIDGTPASRAGLQPGDVIASIDGRSTDGLAIDAAAAMLRGPKGSQVHLTIERKAAPASLPVVITRDDIKPVTVSYRMMDHHIGYVRLRLFGQKTGLELHAALVSLRGQGMRALVLDLRNNGGGFINTAIQVCSDFIPAGDLVVSVEHRTGEPEELRAQTTEMAQHPVPMVLLVNNYSASASEITAGCLKDFGVATLVGVKTFGKGSVQNVEPLPQGAALKITIAHFFSPKHHEIHHVGITPDVEVPMDVKLVGQDGDTQLAKAIDLLTSKVNAMR